MVLRSLHLPKNNSLYVLTPDIAPTASTSKNRYSLTPILIMGINPFLSFCCVYTINHYRCMSAVQTPGGAISPLIKRRGSQRCFHSFIRSHLTWQCTFAFHILCDILRRWEERLVPHSLCVMQIIILSSVFVIFAMILLLAKGFPLHLSLQKLCMWQPHFISIIYTLLERSHINTQ